MILSLSVPRVAATLAVAGLIAGGTFASSSSNADDDGPVTASRTAVSHRADISARHDVAARPNPTKVQTIW
jgi:predicted ribosomally synthesized peptide with SipW-like signal peptide